MTTVEKFETWAIVEIMGHKKFAGFVSEQAIGGSSFVRIDVPLITLDTGTQLPAFTKLFGAGSIYCISPCTEETGRAFAAQLRSESFSKYEAPRLPAPQPPSEPAPGEFGGGWLDNDNADDDVDDDDDYMTDADDLED